MTSTGTLSSALVRFIMVSHTSSDVLYPRMISTNFIIGAGFIKCIPMTLSGLLVIDAIFVNEMAEVLLAKIVFGAHIRSRSVNIFNLRDSFSVAASITNSAFSTADSRSEFRVRRFKVFILSSPVNLAFSTIRSRFLVIEAKAFSNAGAEISFKTT